MTHGQISCTKILVRVSSTFLYKKLGPSAISFTILNYKYMHSRIVCLTLEGNLVYE